MPNGCLNNVIIEGDKKILQHVKRTLRGRDVLFEQFEIGGSHE